jgi:hypothetical protein
MLPRQDVTHLPAGRRWREAGTPTAILSSKADLRNLKFLFPRPPKIDLLHPRGHPKYRFRTEIKNLLGLRRRDLVPDPLRDKGRPSGEGCPELPVLHHHHDPGP